MQYFVISLARTPERLNAFFERNGHRDLIRRFEAVDGRTLNVGELEQAGLVCPGYTGYSMPSLGAALSHRSLWMRAAAGGEAVTVFEDDGILHSRFIELAARLTPADAGAYDFIQWGWNFDSILSFQLPGGVSCCTATFDQAALRRNSAVFPQVQAQHQLYRLQGSFGIMAYTVSPAGAARLLRTCFPVGTTEAVRIDGLGRMVVNRDIDIALNNLYREETARCLVCFPPLAASRNEHASSTIRGAG